MGIDRIGKLGGSAGVTTPAATEVQPAAAEQASFEVPAKPAAEKTSALDPLQQLQAGEIDFDRYVDLRLDQATAHLRGRLDPERLQFVREALRVELESDPVLADLLQRATGQAGGGHDSG